jgi:hypothetical protein
MSPPRSDPKTAKRRSRSMSCHLVNLQCQLGIDLDDLPPVAASAVDGLLAAVLCSRAVRRLGEPSGLARYGRMASANLCHVRQW